MAPADPTVTLPTCPACPQNVLMKKKNPLTQQQFCFVNLSMAALAEVSRYVNKDAHCILFVYINQKYLGMSIDRH